MSTDIYFTYLLDISIGVKVKHVKRSI